MNKLLSLLLLLPAITLQAQTNSLPPNYKTILTDQSFRVISVHYGAHEKVPVHDHPAIPTVFVYLNNSGPIKIIHDGPDASTVTRPPTHLGAFRVGPGIVERHAIDNPSDLPSDFLRVELLHLDDKIVEFRGPAPTDLTHNLSATEFSSPNLTVARTICAAPTPCPLPPSPQSSVIVAFTPLTLSINNQPKKLELGDVIPIAPNQSPTITPEASTPAHLLQISVTSSTP